MASRSDAMDSKGIGASVAPQGGRRFLTGTRQLHRRHQPARPALRRVPALARTRTRAIRSIDTDAGEGRARRARRLHRRRHGRRRARRHALRLADHTARTARRWTSRRIRCSRRQGAPRRRSGRGGRSPRPRQQAKDAAELVESTTTTLPAVAHRRTTRSQPGAPLVHDEAPGNVCYDWHIGDKAAVDAAFAKAAHVVKLELHQQPARSRTRWSRAPPSATTTASTGDYTLYTTSQNPHVDRLLMGAFVLQHARSTSCASSRPTSAAASARRSTTTPRRRSSPGPRGKLGRPVKWTAERSESFLSDAHGRDHVTHAELALDEDGKFLGAARQHARPTWAPTCRPSRRRSRPTSTRRCSPAPYKTPAIYAEVKAVFTNTVPVDAYRGAGRPEATLPARAAGRQGRARDRASTGSRSGGSNFIPTDAVPVPDAGGAAVRQRRLPDDARHGAARRPTTPASRRARRSRDSAASCAASASRPTSRPAASRRRPWSARSARAPACTRSAKVRVHPTGSVTVFTGTHSHGQGHETTFAQLVVDQLGVPLDSVEVVHGDTDQDPVRHGHLRLALAWPSAARRWSRRWTRSSPRARRSPPICWRRAVDDIEFKDGKFTRRRHRPREDASARSRFAAYVPHNYPIEELEPGLDETAFYDPKNFTFPGGCHICEVEIDPRDRRRRGRGLHRRRRCRPGHQPDDRRGPGARRRRAGHRPGAAGERGLRRRRAAADRLVHGLHACRAPTTCRTFKVGNRDTRCARTTRSASKGCGEVGAIGVAAGGDQRGGRRAARLGVRHIDMPATPEKIWSIIQAGRPRMAAE